MINERRIGLASLPLREYTNGPFEVLVVVFNSFGTRGKYLRISSVRG